MRKKLTDQNNDNENSDSNSLPFENLNNRIN